MAQKHRIFGGFVDFALILENPVAFCAFYQIEDQGGVFSPLPGFLLRRRAVWRHIAQQSGGGIHVKQGYEARYKKRRRIEDGMERRRPGIRLFSTILYIPEVCLMAALTGFRQNLTKIL